MVVGQAITNSLPNERATRDLDEVSRTVLEILDVAVGGGRVSCLVAALTPVSRNVFNWEAAERRADWEENHGRFVEFGDVKDLLLDLHS
ncbi:hypothetical protein KAI31_05125 [Candidatus Bathyarchaeota archaeon]|nr:hypothetical protein [Candidatus Bathyarchaeota archaeon]